MQAQTCVDHETVIFLKKIQKVPLHYTLIYSKHTDMFLMPEMIRLTRPFIAADRAELYYFIFPIILLNSYDESL